MTKRMHAGLLFSAAAAAAAAAGLTGIVACGTTTDSPGSASTAQDWATDAGAGATGDDGGATLSQNDAGACASGSQLAISDCSSGQLVAMLQAIDASEIDEAQLAVLREGSESSRGPGGDVGRDAQLPVELWQGHAETRQHLRLRARGVTPIAQGQGCIERQVPLEVFGRGLHVRQTWRDSTGRRPRS